MSHARVARMAAAGASSPGLRQRKTLATRRRVVHAAYVLFCEHGYASTTMEAIARAGEVAVQTLYFTFGTKGAILGEALGAAVLGFGEPEDPQNSDWSRAFEKERDAARALGLLVKHTVPIVRRTAPLIEAMKAALADPDAREVYLTGEQRREAAYARFTRALANKPGGLRRGLPVARATDLLLVLLGPELYQSLSAGRGWTHAACERWLRQVLVDQLLPGRAP